MFGLGFTEIFIIAVVAILFLGPDKLPSTMVEIAKFFKNVKKTVSSVKDTIEEEINISDIKQEALSYKKELLDAQDTLHKATDIKSTVADLANLDDDILGIDNLDKPKIKTKSEEITFKKKTKKENKNVS